jgi:molybdenum transport protein
LAYLSINEIEQLIKEDVPYIDLTSWTLGIREQPGRITYFTREEAIVCGTEEVRKVFEQLGIKLEAMIPSGEIIKPGDTIISGTGRGADLHMAWKVGQNILDSCSGIATKTRTMVEQVKAVNPHIAVLTTRKGFPGTKVLTTKAILAGGAMPHRLGLSETILVFKQHMNFIGGFEGLLKKIPEIKTESCEKKVIVEATELEKAIRLCHAGADGIQFDKLTVAELEKAVSALKKEFPGVTILGAGGINEKNCGDYAKTGIDGIVTTSLYRAKPIDIGVKIEKVEV